MDNNEGIWNHVPRSVGLCNRVDNVPSSKQPRGRRRFGYISDNTVCYRWACSYGMELLRHQCRAPYLRNCHTRQRFRMEDRVCHSLHFRPSEHISEHNSCGISPQPFRCHRPASVHGARRCLFGNRNRLQHIPGRLQRRHGHHRADCLQVPQHFSWQVDSRDGRCHNHGFGVLSLVQTGRN